jgi:hypothetical protein
MSAEWWIGEYLGKSGHILIEVLLPWSGRTEEIYKNLRITGVRAEIRTDPPPTEYKSYRVAVIPICSVSLVWPVKRSRRVYGYSHGDKKPLFGLRFFQLCQKDSGLCQDSCLFINLLRCGRAIAEAVSRCLPTTAARVQSRIWSSGICGGQSGVGAGFLRVLPFPLPFIPPNSPSSQSPGAGTIGQWVADVPSGPRLDSTPHYAN